MYGQVDTPMFIDFHEKLKNIAETKGINYILRHFIKDYNVNIYIYNGNIYILDIVYTIQNFVSYI